MRDLVRIIKLNNPLKVNFVNVMPMQKGMVLLFLMNILTEHFLELRITDHNSNK